MNKEEFEYFKVNRYEKEIKYYDDRSKWNHSAFQVSQWTVIIFSAITPALVVVSTGWIRWVTVCVAIIVAIASGALRAFKYQENWVNYRTTCETLRKEISYFTAEVQGYERVEDKQALFVERIESLISRENTLWISTHQEEDDQNKGSKK
jgi:uncharacterized membrane protein YdbT with pleckstrin-like domain